MLKRVLYPHNVVANVAKSGMEATLGTESSNAGGSTAQYHLILHTKGKGEEHGNDAAHLWHAAESIQLAGVLAVR